MTEKRFKVYKVIGSFSEWSVEDTVDDKVVFGSIMHKYEADRLCDKLNELNGENEQLKYTLSAYIVDLNNYKGKCSALEEENEQLKQTVSDWSGSYDGLYEDVKRLEEENEQLKEEIKDLNDVLARYEEKELQE